MFLLKFIQDKILPNKAVDDHHLHVTFGNWHHLGAVAFSVSCKIYTEPNP